MNILPDDAPDAAALREELGEKRASVHFEVGRFVASETSPAESASALVGEFGFSAPPDWTALSPNQALTFVVRLLAREPSSDSPPMPLPEAEALAARIRALFSERAVFFPMGDRHGRSEAGNLLADAATFESGMLVIDGDRAALIWGEGGD